MRSIALFFIFITGFSALVCQVVWQRYLSYFLGGEALASTLVVAVFLGGMSVGYYLFGKYAKDLDSQKLLKLAGITEGLIGVWAFLFPQIFEKLWARLDIMPSSQPWQFLSNLFITILFLAPPTIGMGSSLPLLTQGLTRASKELSRIHAIIYGINTLGAFLGALVGGFILIPSLGLPISLMLVGLFNIAAGFALYSVGVYSKPLPAEPVPQRAESQPLLRLILPLSFLAGFLAIGFEIQLMRAMNLAIGTSEYTYTITVAVFILMIALGALFLKTKDWQPSLLAKNQLWICLGLMLVHLSVPYWGYVNYLVRQSLTTIPTNFYVHQLIIFSLFSLLISIPVSFTGKTLPLLFSSFRSDVNGSAEKVGITYGWNTVGSCLGGLFLGYFALFFFNGDVVFKIGIFVAIASLLIISLMMNGKEKKIWLSISTILALTTLVLPYWQPHQMASGLYRMRIFFPTAFRSPSAFIKERSQVFKFLSYRDDPNTNVSVIATPEKSSFADETRALVVNGKSDGNTTDSDYLTNLFLAHVPGLFSAEPGDAAMVGLGLGGTASTISLYSHIQHLSVFEISKAVIDAQPYFDSINHNILKNPKVSVSQMDAFRALISYPGQLSVIMSEPSNPWVVGVDRLYTSEFYDAVKKKLLPQGVLCQWIHTYEMSEPTFGITMRTFTDSFPNYLIFANNVDVFLLGSQQSLSTSAIFKMAHDRWKNENVGTMLSKFKYNTFGVFSLSEKFFPSEYAQKFSANSLFFPKLSYSAAKDFFMANNYSFEKSLFESPALAYLTRQKLPSALSSFLLKENLLTQEDIIAFCKKPIAELLLSNRLGYSLCETQAYSWALKNKVSSPAISWIQNVQQGVDTQILNLDQKFHVLLNFPIDTPTPNIKIFKSLWHQCPLENDKLIKCQNIILSLMIQFGHFKDVIEALSVVKDRDLQLRIKYALGELETMLGPK